MTQTCSKMLVASTLLVGSLFLLACTWGGSQAMPITPSVAPAPDGMTIVRGRDGEVRVKRLDGEGEVVWDALVRNGSTWCEWVPDDTGGVIV